MKNLNKENIEFAITMAFTPTYSKSRGYWKRGAKIKQDLLKGIHKLLISDGEWLIPKKEIAILDTKIIEFYDANMSKERQIFKEELANFILGSCQAIIRDENIIKILYK
jgi:hypothetical protein